MSTLRKLIIGAVLTGAATFGICSVASASAPGFYVGGQLGESKTHYGKSEFTTSDSFHLVPGSVNNRGLGGRVFLGYQIDQNWAVEGGYTRFKKATASNYSVAGSESIKTEAVDIVGKGILPLNDMFGLYAKLGIAYVRADHSASGDLNPSSDSRKVVPAYGVGASYDVTPVVPVFVDFTRMQKSGSIQNADLLSVGVAYHFG